MVLCRKTCRGLIIVRNPNDAGQKDALGAETMLLNRISSRVIIAFINLGFVISATAVDWPQWGCVNNRNMISQEKGLPSSFEADKDKAMNRSNGGTKAENVK
jgi:hypothetical protein